MHGMVALVGVPNPERPGSELVKAYITIKPNYVYDGNEATLKENIISWAKGKLTPYEVPKSIEIRKELPLTVVGRSTRRCYARNPAKQSNIFFNAIPFFRFHPCNFL